MLEHFLSTHFKYALTEFTSELC